jgi:hypothetical protein
MRPNIKAIVTLLMSLSSWLGCTDQQPSVG